VLFVLGDILLCPMLLRVLLLPNLVIAAHDTDQSSPGRAYCGSLSGASRDRATNCAQCRTTSRTSQQPALWCLGGRSRS
jgi:hypothetical protein